MRLAPAETREFDAMAQVETGIAQARDMLSWRDRAGFALIGLGALATALWCGAVAASVSMVVIGLAR